MNSLKSTNMTQHNLIYDALFFRNLPNCMIIKN